MRTTGSAAGRIGALVLLAAVAAAPSGCGEPGRASGGAPAENGESAVNVRALTVESATLQEYLTVSGPLGPFRGADVSTQESGVVTVIPEDKGAWVEEGDPVVVLERDLLAAEVRAAEAALELAEYNESRLGELFEAEQISRLEMLEATTELETAAARAEMARIRYERAAIRAPFAGVVADRYVEVGELVAAGTIVARVVDPRVLKLEAAVSEREVRFLEPGTPALVQADGVGEAREGTVHWVSFEASPSSGKFQAEIRVDNADGVFRPGVVARARVTKDVHHEAVLVPRDAVLLRGGEPAVFVLDGDRARLRGVALSADQGMMAVVASGLEPGERIVVRGQRDLTDGALVAVREETRSPDGAMDHDPGTVRADDPGAGDGQ